MADVQLEHGHTRIANALIEALCRTRLPGRHLAVMLAIARKTYGFNRTADRISVSQLVEMTGVDEREIRRILNDLIERKMISRAGEVGRTPELRIEKDFDLWTPGAQTQGEEPRGVYAPPGCTNPGTPGEEHPKTPGAGTRDKRHKDRRQKIKRERAAAPLALAGEPDQKRPPSKKTPPPDKLPAEERADLLTWCEGKHPQLVARIDQLIEACLRYSRQEGQTKWRASYYAACQTWFDREAQSGPRARASPPRGSRPAIGGHDEWAYAMEGKGK